MRKHQRYGKIDHYQYGSGIRATTSLFPFDGRMADFLRATERGTLQLLQKSMLLFWKLMKKFPKIHLPIMTKLLKLIFQPWNQRSMDHILQTHDTNFRTWKMNSSAWFARKVSACLIGSCTNSSYEDIGRCCTRENGKWKGLRFAIAIDDFSGSNRIAETMKRDGFLDIFEKSRRNNSQ